MMLSVHSLRRWGGLLAAVLLLTALSAESQADMFEVTCISNNDAVSAGIGEAQFSVSVTDVGSNQVLFTFLNIGSFASAITDVYMDDTAGLLSNMVIDNGLGVLFADGAAPPVLPGGPGLTPTFIATFSADSESNPDNTVVNGVNPGESLGLLFDIEAGSDFDDVITALFAGFDGEDTLRVGLHAQSIEWTDIDGVLQNESETFLVTPVPGAMLLGSLGLGASGYFLRRRKGLA